MVMSHTNFHDLEEVKRLVNRLATRQFPMVVIQNPAPHGYRICFLERAAESIAKYGGEIVHTVQP